MTICPKLRFNGLNMGFDKCLYLGMHGLTMFCCCKHQGIARHNDFPILINYLNRIFIKNFIVYVRKLCIVFTIYNTAIIFKQQKGATR